MLTLAPPAVTSCCSWCADSGGAVASDVLHLRRPPACYTQIHLPHRHAWNVPPAMHRLTYLVGERCSSSEAAVQEPVVAHRQHCIQGVLGRLQPVSQEQPSPGRATHASCPTGTLNPCHSPRRRSSDGWRLNRRVRPLMAPAHAHHAALRHPGGSAGGGGRVHSRDSPSLPRHVWEGPRHGAGALVSAAQHAVPQRVQSGGSEGTHCSLFARPGVAPSWLAELTQQHLLGGVGESTPWLCLGPRKGPRQPYRCSATLGEVEVKQTWHR